MDITLALLLAAIFDKEVILNQARQVGAMTRLREIHPADFIQSLIVSAMGDEERTIATARRTYGQISGFSPEESAYYGHFNKGMTRLISSLLRNAIEKAPIYSKPLLAQLLDKAGLVDMLAVDGCRFSMPSWTKTVFPSTDDNHGGVKLTAFMSVLSNTIKKVIITDARQHDRKAIKMPRWLHGQLFLFDRGYCDRKLFVQIEDRFGAFLCRFKKNQYPIITNIRSGLDSSFIGKQFKADLPFNGVLDIDAQFKMKGGVVREFRIVLLCVGVQHCKDGDKPVELLFVTNLTVEQFTVEQLATLYRFRWEIERLFAVAKGVARLDHLRSGNRNVVEAFVYSSVLAVVLGLRVCGWMRRQKLRCEPSLWRVTTLVLQWLPNLIRMQGSSYWDRWVGAFEQALWREGVNPNPGRPYTSKTYTFELVWQEACRPACATS